MDIRELITPDRVLLGLRVADKEQLLHELGRQAGLMLGRDGASIAGALAARERLGSTGLGRGIALPHTTLAGLSQFFGLAARLYRPIGFDAIDEQPIDMAFLLLIPNGAEGEHVAALAAVSRQLRDAERMQRIRRAPDRASFHRLLVEAAA